MPHGLFTIDVKFDEHHLSNDGAVAWSFKVGDKPGHALQPYFQSRLAVNISALRWLFG